MTRSFLVIILNFYLFTSTGQHNETRLSSNDHKCKDNWQYITLKDTIKGQVLFHAKGPTPCGVLATASVTIIKRTSDTIRVLELCDTRKDFEKLKFVKVAPGKKPPFSVVFPIDNKHFDCLVSKTCYGTVDIYNNKK